jgi:drug/metabolite transporter (DMT)-like permease
MLTAGLGANVAMAMLGMSLLAVRRRRPFRRAIDLPAAIMAMSGVVLVLAGARARGADDGGDLDRLCALYGWPEAAVEHGACLVAAALWAMTILLHREHR